MNESGNHNGNGRSLKTFILEDRELYRFFLRHWLEGRNGHQVTFFNSPDGMEANTEPRDVELLAVHLLPERGHLTRNGCAHAHGVYGEGLDSSTVLWCRKSGVKGIFDLRDGLEDWQCCFESVSQGQAAETSSARQALNHGQGKGLAKLSRRENEVARMLVKGYSAKQVAVSLGTSEGTVKNQRKAVYRKLGIVRATQLAGAMGFRAR